MGLERVIPEFIWVVKWLIELPYLLVYWFGRLLPVDWRHEFIFNGKPMEKRLRSLEKAGSLTGEELKDIAFSSEFSVVDIRDVPRSEACQTIAKLKLDPFGRLRYSRPAHQNPANPDLIEITLSHKDDPAPFLILINNYIGANEEFTDFAPQDVVTFFLQDSKPIFIYNHHTHVLSNCDYYDLYIGAHDGASMHKKSTALAKRVQDVVMFLRENGQVTNTGKKPARAALHHHSFDELPLVLIDKMRDAYNILFIAGAACLALYLIYIIAASFLTK